MTCNDRIGDASPCRDCGHHQHCRDNSDSCPAFALFAALKPFADASRKPALIRMAHQREDVVRILKSRGPMTPHEIAEAMTVTTTKPPRIVSLPLARKLLERLLRDGKVIATKFYSGQKWEAR